MADRLFKLETPDFNKIVPDSGEQLGANLAKLGKEILDRAPLDSYWRRQAATLFYLAADAYQAGADASFGHNRTARYEEQAKRLIAHAEAL